MLALAEIVNAVVGIDTHRDVHEAELTAPTGAVIARLQIPNSDAGFRRLLTWIEDNAPGPQLVVSVEGTRSYGIGLVRALTAGGLQVVECEQPTRKSRRGRGKSDAIDAHLAALFALALPADRLPTPRADGIREALRILLSARQEMVTTSTGQTNRLRALLLSGDDGDRDLSRSTLTAAALSTLGRRRLRSDADHHAAVHHQEIRRLACALRDADRLLKANRRQLQQLVHEIATGLIDRPGIGPVSAAQVIVSFSHPGRVRNDSAFAALAGTSPIPAKQRSDQAPPPQPRRRPSTEPGRAHHRTDPHAKLPTDARLRPAHRRRQITPRDPPHPQALHHPRALPQSDRRHDPLTHIEASGRVSIATDEPSGPSVQQSPVSGPLRESSSSGSYDSATCRLSLVHRGKGGPVNVGVGLCLGPREGALLGPVRHHRPTPTFQSVVTLRLALSTRGSRAVYFVTRPGTCSLWPGLS